MALELRIVLGTCLLNLMPQPNIEIPLFGNFFFLNKQVVFELLPDPNEVRIDTPLLLATVEYLLKKVPPSY